LPAPAPPRLWRAHPRRRENICEAKN
jgi:hypothetical protein